MMIHGVNQSFIGQIFSEWLLCVKCCPREVMTKAGNVPTHMVGEGDKNLKNE